MKTDIERVLLKEEKDGSPVDFFVSYVNMYREMKNIFSSDEIHELWKENRRQIYYQDQIREKVLESSYLENIKGFEKLEEYIDEGGVIFSFHYGNYRALYAAIAEVLYYEYPDKILNIIIDRPSYEAEPEIYKKHKNLRYIISQEMNVGMEIMNELDKGNFIAIFLDGNSGYAADRRPIQLELMTSKIQIRSGIFRIMSKLGKPFFPILAEGDYRNQKFEVGDNINEKGIDPNELADRCYEIFRTKLRQHPEYWRLWYRHDKQIVDWDKSETENEGLGDVFMWHGDKRIGINMKNARFVEF